MTSRSTSQKTLQSFHARTGLWEAFVRRAQEMDCSVDYLVNEAMRLYASSHDFLDPADAPTGQHPPTPQPAAPAKSPSLKSTVRAKPSSGLPRPGAKARTPAAVPVPRPSQAPPPMRGPAAAGPPTLPRPGGSAPGSGARPAPAAQPQRTSLPPPPPPRPAGNTGASGVARPPLMLVFQGRKVPIVQDQFIIGRGSKSSDLAIKDANISRKHAAVIFHNGAFYMKDLGSTNGVEYKGKPVDSKRIDEGDVFTICGHDIHFTYSG
ncbi:MAG TPA: FHA domain-containing protein [Polyangia bacterium]|nr:FHA domain-containing protein [Polyangia bacterium]